MPHDTQKQLSETAEAIEKRQEARIMEGIRNYARADRSDPFTLARCLAHKRSGIIKMGEAFTDEDGNYVKMKDVLYEAMETREDAETVTGDKYKKRAWRNMVRP